MASRLARSEMRLNTIEESLRRGSHGWRHRRRLTKEHEAARHDVALLQEVFGDLVAPLREDLDQQLDTSRSGLASLERDNMERRTRARFLDVSTRVRSIDRELGVDHGIEIEDYGMEL